MFSLFDEKDHDSENDFNLEEEELDPDFFIQEYTDSCPKHPWNDKDGCTACDHTAYGERCPRHTWALKGTCPICTSQNQEDDDGFWHYPVQLQKEKCPLHPFNDKETCRFCKRVMCPIHPRYDKDQCFICLNRCPEHHFYSKSSCPICKPMCPKHPFFEKDICEICHPKTCVLGHSLEGETDDSCAYCYMIKHKNHRGKMLDWLHCPNHNGFTSKDRECPWCFLIRQKKCPKHPLIIKGHCDVCDYPNGVRPVKKYNPWDTCPKDKGRLKMNCIPCKKSLTHCPIHPEEVKDGCEFCYFEMCGKHPDYRKEDCSRCATDKHIEAFLSKGKAFLF